MSDSTGTARGKGAKMTRGEQLSCLLSIPGLRHLTDAEADRLVEHLNHVADEASNAAYGEGWDAALEYNHDMAFLHSTPLSTGH